MTIAPELLKRVPTRRLLLVVLPVLLTGLGLAAAAFGRQLVDWKVKADASISDLLSFKTQAQVVQSAQSKQLTTVEAELTEIRKLQLDQYRDSLYFQRDIYRTIGEYSKAKSSHDKAESLK